ncbi:TIGR00296 family protein [Candidatus Thorarchaeota archaeon]|nr:MAG: TIGR00296 family protein [Candidatus Thorarchaeota archaeon]
MLDHAYEIEDGRFLVKLARHALEEYLTQKSEIAIPDDTPNHLRVESGVFVTLNKVQGEQSVLRGCIGRPYPAQSLVQATIESAIDAAVNDPRFPPVRAAELDSITLDLSVLTPPTKIEYDEPGQLLEKVQVGRDGLIAVRGAWRGLLLPQVPVEWGWDVKEFLEHTCNKAGLPRNAWMDPQTEFYAFQADVFGEKKPKGEVVRNPKGEVCRS